MTTGEVIALIKAFGGSGGGSSGGGVLVVHDVNGTLDKTYKEIADAGFAVMCLPDSELEGNFYVYLLASFGPYTDGDVTTYSVSFSFKGGPWMYFDATSENGYPVYSE